MNEQNNNKISHQRYSTLFLCVLSIFTIAFIGYLSYAHKTSIKSQQLIIESYAKHIEKADSLYFDIAKYNKDVLIANQNINNAILIDSLMKETLNKSQKLSVWQKKNLAHTINNYFNKIEVLHKQYGKNLSKDSLRLFTERELLEGQTKAMLELHLSRIEHEYSNITMWGAVLTILFLVFSFYSIFKMDELIKQGNEGVNEIKNLKGDGEKIVEQFKQEKQDVVNDTKDQLLKMTDTVAKAQKQMEEQFQNASNSLNSTKSALIAKSESMLKNFGEQLADITNAHKTSSEARQQELNEIVTQANSILKQLRDNLNSKEGEQQNG